MGFGTPPPAGLQQAPEEGSYLEKLQRILMAGGGNAGGMLDEGQQKAARNQAMMAMAAQLMQAGGQSDRRVSFGEAMGSGLQAGMQAGQQAEQNALKSLLLQSQIQKAKNTPAKKPSDVQSYEYAKANGYAGSFEDWKRIAAAQKQPTSDVQNWEYYQKLNPEQQKEWMSLQRQPTAPQVVMVNGVPTLVDRFQGTQTALSSQQSEVEAERLKQFEGALAKARGTSQGEREGDIAKKGQSANQVQGMLSLADPLIDVATGSGPGAAADKVAGWFGASLDGAKATAQLRVLQASLMTNMPRMEGPQSDADVLLYRQAAGEIGDPSVPRGLKKAALQTIRALQNKYAERASTLPQPGLPAQAPAAPPTRPPLSSFQK